MKKIMKKIIFGMFLIGMFTLNAQVNFEAKSLKEAIELAKKSKKRVIIDFTATWCGPCKLMDKKVFSKPEVGNIVNNKFVAVKMDVDTPEGKELQSKYSIDSVPTMILIDTDGRVLKRLEGYHDDKKLIQELKNL
jgi:thioredoxin 1